MRIYLSLLAVLLSLLLIPDTGAIPYPSTTPTGEVGSGTFNGYFANMFNTSGCTGGQVLRGFTPTGILLCTSVALTPIQYWTSTDAGATIYFTGAGNVGIGTTTPQTPLDVI